MSKSASATAWGRIPGVSSIPPCRFAKRPSSPAPAPFAAWATRSPSKAAVFGDVAECRLVIAGDCASHVQRDAVPARILVHELRHRARGACQQASAQQFEAERAEIRRLELRADALGKPAHQMRG